MPFFWAFAGRNVEGSHIGGMTGDISARAGRGGKVASKRCNLMNLFKSRVLLLLTGGLGGEGVATWVDLRAPQREPFFLLLTVTSHVLSVW